MGGIHHMPGADFTNIYAAGRLARGGHVALAYDPQSYQALKQALLGIVPERADWVYPPPALLLGAVFSCLRLQAAFFLWNGFTLVAMLTLLRRAGLGWGVVAWTIVSPAEYRCLMLGQLDGLLACCLAAGLLCSGRRPVAGLLLGLTVLKPQAGLLAPLALLAARRGQAFAAGAVTAAMLCLAPRVFGWDSWGLYLSRSGAVARGLLQAPFGQSYQLNGVSVFWMLRSLGAGLGLAYAGQGLAAGLAGIGVWHVWRMPDADPRTAVALTLLLSLYVTPYGFSSDMVGYTLALALLAARKGWRVSLADGLLWLWPGFIVLFTMFTGVLLTPLVVGVAVFRVWRELRPA